MLARYFTFLCFIINYVQYVKGDEAIETFCTINGEKPLHYISEKFLSISIDPAVLASRLNLGDTALLLAGHLSPAYIRIAGPSTNSIKYVGNGRESNATVSKDENIIPVTSSIWFGINEWIKLANLTPVFGISDVDTSNGVWDPKSTLPLLEISDKWNISCHWMLGFDPSNKNATQYKQDLRIFQKALSSFPQRNESWKIVGSDLSQISDADNETIVSDIQDIVTAVMWEPNASENATFETEPFTKISSDESLKHIKIWTTAPKCSQPVTFRSALLWAAQVGDAAKMGYDVIFREPIQDEIFSDTPVYWFSLLHKKLMGTAVLEVEPLIQTPGSSVYAHGVAKQNGSIKKGFTLMIVNNNSKNYKINVKMIPGYRFSKLHSYILTSKTENSTDIFLNGNQLKPEILSEKEPFKSKTQNLKFKMVVPLEVPPMSISFFVMLHTCDNDQNSSSEEDSLSVEPLPIIKPRGLFLSNNPKIKTLMESDEAISKASLKMEIDALKQKIAAVEDKIDSRQRNYHLANTNLQQKNQINPSNMREELKKVIADKTRQYYTNRKRMGHVPEYVDMTSEQTSNVLRHRANEKAERMNIVLNNNELDAIVEAVKRAIMQPNYIRRSRGINTMEKNNESSNEKNTNSRHIKDVNMKLLNLKSKLKENRERFEDSFLGNTQELKRSIKDKINQIKQKNKVYRLKRDINMDLLKRKTEGLRETKISKPWSRSFFRNKEEKRATTRKADKTSDELLAELLEAENDEYSKENAVPKMDIFAQFATTAESGDMSLEYLDTNDKPRKMSLLDKIRKNKFSLSTPKNDDSRSKHRQNNEEPKDVNDPMKFLTTSEEFNDFEEDLPCIHEYFDNSRKEEVGQLQKILKTKTKEKGKVGKTNTATPDSMEYLRRRRQEQAMDNDNDVSNESDARERLSEEETGETFLQSGNRDDVSHEDKSTFELEDRNTFNKLTTEKLRDRKRRDVDNKTPEVIESENQRSKAVPRIDLKQRLKDIQEGAWQKLKLGADQNEEQLKKNDIKEKLQDIKEKLSLKRKQTESVLAKVKLEGRSDFANNGNMKEGSRFGNLKSRFNNAVESSKTNSTDTSSPVQMVKRSIFDQKINLFGNYEPITPELKVWKPSDILSLKRDIQFPIASELKDFQMFRNIFHPNNFFYMQRKRRSIPSSWNEAENEVDADMNNLEDSQRRSLHNELDISEIDVNNEEVTNKSLMDGVLIGRNKETTLVNDTVAAENNFSEDLDRDENNSTVLNVTSMTNETHDDCVTKEEKSIFDALFRSVSGIFSNMGETLGQYFKNI